MRYFFGVLATQLKIIYFFAKFIRNDTGRQRPKVQKKKAVDHMGESIGGTGGPDPLKGKLLSKAQTCMIFFLYIKKKLLYNRYLWLYCCMNNLYISHRSLYALTYNLSSQQHAYKSFIVAYWVYFR